MMIGIVVLLFGFLRIRVTSRISQTIWASNYLVKRQSCGKGIGEEFEEDHFLFGESIWFHGR